MSCHLTLRRRSLFRQSRPNRPSLRYAFNLVVLPRVISATTVYCVRIVNALRTILGPDSADAERRNFQRERKRETSLVGSGMNSGGTLGTIRIRDAADMLLVIPDVLLMGLTVVDLAGFGKIRNTCISNCFIIIIIKVYNK